jgi:1,4-alpha-glucan branching enzyme
MGVWHIPERAANLRALYAHMWMYPGKKLLFMGGEFGQHREWNHDTSLDWHLAELPTHKALQTWVSDLNKLIQTEKAMHEGDHFEWGFKWIDCADSEQSVVSFIRYDEAQETGVAFVFNFTPVPRHDYRIGLPWAGEWQEVLNSDAPAYNGSGVGNMGAVTAEEVPMHGLSHSVNLTLPPLGVLVFKGVKPAEAEGAETEETEDTEDVVPAPKSKAQVKEASEGV